MVIELTDNTVATPFGSASPQLIGLSNIQLNGSTSHVIGWECILPLCTVSDAALVAPYTLTQTEPKELGSVLPPISWSSLECELIDGSVDGAGCGIDNEAREADGRDICNLIVKNGVQLCVTVMQNKGAALDSRWHTRSHRHVAGRLAGRLWMMMAGLWVVAVAMALES